MQGLTIIQILSVILPTALASNILVVAPFPAKSHAMLFDPLVVDLAERGHKVTFMTAFGLKKPHQNINIIKLPGKEEHAGSMPDLFGMRHFGAVENAIFLPIMCLEMCNNTIRHEAFQTLVQSKAKFDVIIYEAFLTEAIVAGLTHVFKAPIIGYGTFMPSYWINYWVGNEAPSSYVPDPFTSLPSKMNFWQRMKNFLFLQAVTPFHYVAHILRHDALVKEVFGPDVPFITDIIKNTSVFLVNDHFSTTFVKPATPNLINVGGLHVQPPKPLPQDIKTFLDNSKNGAILFTLGSNLQSSEMGEERIKMFLEAFSKLKENVLWKFEKDLPNKPKNLLISPWFPQADILAHPNIKLFITHGGLLGTTESIDRGVPIIGIPIFGDQPMNTDQSVNAGVGLKLDFDALSADAIYSKIREVIDNPKYKQAALARSAQFKDRPQSPMDLAIYWVEYVIRHKGARHLRSGKQDLSWYEADQLDVIAVLIVGALILSCVTKCAIKCIFRTLCGAKKSTKKEKKTN